MKFGADRNRALYALYGRRSGSPVTARSYQAVKARPTTAIASAAARYRGLRIANAHAITAITKPSYGRVLARIAIPLPMASAAAVRGCVDRRSAPPIANA